MHAWRLRTAFALLAAGSLLAACAGGAGTPTLLPRLRAENGVGAATTARGTYRMEVTFYGWPDNTPPSGAIAYPIIHKTAGGIGSYANPITFATDRSEIAPGTRLYLPLVKKYLIMEDDCTECDRDWSTRRKRHIDVWTNSNAKSNTNAVLNCEDQLTPARAVPVIVDPRAGLTVSKRPLYDIARNWCYFGPNPVSTSAPGNNTPAPPR